MQCAYCNIPTIETPHGLKTCIHFVGFTAGQPIFEMKRSYDDAFHIVTSVRRMMDNAKSQGHNGLYLSVPEVETILGLLLGQFHRLEDNTPRIP